MTNKQNSFVNFSIALVALLAFGLGCGSLTGEKPATNSGSTSNSTTNSTTNSTSNTTFNSTGNSTTNSTSTSDSTTSTTAKDISGNYDVSGSNAGGAGNYKGALIVASRGDVYQFSWNTAGKKYDGVGVQTGNKVAVAFAEGTNGKGCGVTLYKINSDGSLDGKVGYWGVNQAESEKAVRTSGTDLEGDYDISGKNPDGKEFKGTLKVKSEASGYTFTWNAGNTFTGFGVKQGDTVSVGIGGTQCGFVSYEVKPDGTMEGKWGGYGSKELGSETAKKK